MRPGRRNGLVEIQTLGAWSDALNSGCWRAVTEVSWRRARRTAAGRGSVKLGRQTTGAIARTETHGRSDIWLWLPWCLHGMYAMVSRGRLRRVSAGWGGANRQCDSEPAESPDCCGVARPRGHQTRALGPQKSVQGRIFLVPGSRCLQEISYLEDSSMRYKIELRRPP